MGTGNETTNKYCSSHAQSWLSAVTPTTPGPTEGTTAHAYNETFAVVRLASLHSTLGELGD